jgi:hypothetical protein
MTAEACEIRETLYDEQVNEKSMQTNNDSPLKYDTQVISVIYYQKDSDLQPKDMLSTEMVQKQG